MSAKPVAEIITSSGHRKQHGDPDNSTDPVRKHSYDVHDHRAQPWRPIGPPQLGEVFVSALKQAARWLYADQYKRQHDGPDRLTPKHLMLLDGLLRHLDFATGRLDPSFDTLAAAAPCGRTTVSEGLDALSHAGIVCTVRRTRKVEGVDGQKGWHRTQTSDAFYFDCKARMTPELFARFYDFALKKAAEKGRWVKAQVRRLLNIFNSEATPSPREPKVARLLRRVRTIAPEPTADTTETVPKRVPVEGRPGRPDSAPAPNAASARMLSDRGLHDTLSRMASRFGLDLDEVLNASP